MKTKVLNTLAVIGSIFTAILTAVHIGRVMATPIDQPADNSALLPMVLVAIVTLIIYSVTPKAK